MVTAPHPVLSRQAEALFGQDAGLDTLLSAARSHPAVFADVFCTIYDPPTRREFPFKLWDWQWELFDAFVSNNRVIVLKARQLGVSWLLAAYALWVATTRPHSNIILVSRTEGVASELLSKCDFMRLRLHPALLPGSSKRDKFNTTEIYFAANNSRITAAASTKDSGRSSSASLVIPDEWASHPFAEDMYAGYEPTIGTGGQILGCSTAKGRRGLFYNIYRGSRRGANTFTPVFLSAELRPDYTPEFLQAKQEAYELAGTPYLFGQEYPRTEQEAWGGSLSTFFAPDDINHLSSLVLPPVATLDRWDPSLPFGWNGSLRIWHRPIRGHRYVIGADPAGPNASGSRSAATVWDASTPTFRHDATLAGFWAPYDLADALNHLGRMYAADPTIPDAAATLSVEQNNFGSAVLESLTRIHHYHNLYFRKDTRSKKPIAGWLTTNANRLPLLEDFRAGLSGREWTTSDEELVDELTTLEESPNTGRVEAASGARDDLPFASAIAWKARSQYPAVRGSRRTRPLPR